MAKKVKKEENTMMYGVDDDLVLNTTARLPVCLCLDTSGSMTINSAIKALNEGVDALYEAIKSDELACNSCEISIVTFNSEVNVIEEFSTVDKKQQITLTAEGGSALAHGINKSLDLLDRRKNKYKENGVDYYQPWLIVITDGKPGDSEYIQEVQERTKILLDDKKLTLFPIAVGMSRNKTKLKEVLDVLNGFCVTPRALHLKELNFNEFFEFIGKSVSAISASAVGDKVKLDISNMSNWAEL
ncbi:MAG: VWA domain-containing protein [bacterium]